MLLSLVIPAAAGFALGEECCFTALVMSLPVLMTPGIYSTGWQGRTFDCRFIYLTRLIPVCAGYLARERCPPHRWR